MQRYLEKFKYDYFDILIIGGGITGSAIAWDASLRGYKVALIEKKDFGHATSMATSKLIHGGLRYLNTLNLKLVRESLRERRYLCDIIPHQVYPLPFLLPVYKDNPMPKWFIQLGMILYDILSFDKNKVKNKSKKIKMHRWYSKNQTLKIEPHLAPRDLKGAFKYYDFQNLHPERMNLDFITSAVAKGTVAANYLEMTDFIKTRVNGKDEVMGVYAKDILNKNKRMEIHAKVTLNCSGPWTNQILTKGQQNEHKKLILAKGIHLLMPRRQNDHAITIETSDKKHFFVIPWLNYTLLGTTDTEYQGFPDELCVTEKDVHEFLSLVNAHYPASFSADEILYAYAGIRPLVLNELKPKKKVTYKISRSPDIFDHRKENLARLVSVLGGKYTTSRRLAEIVIDYIQKAYDLGNFKSQTRHTSLISANYKDNFEDFVKDTHDIWGQLYSKELIDHLLEYYGTCISRIFNIIKSDSSLLKKISPSHEWILAEIDYAVKEEAAYTLSDFLYRRCGWGNEGLKDKGILDKIASHMGNLLKWSEDEKKRQIGKYLKEQKIKISGS